MNANDVYEMIQQISAARVGNTPVFIDELASKMQMKRIDVISYLVDLKIAGYIEFDTRTVSLSTVVNNVATG